MQRGPDSSPAGPLLPEWYQLYFSAVLEADESKTLGKIGQACQAIEDRLTELTSASLDNPHEMQDLTCSLTYLKLLLQNIDMDGTDEMDGSNWHSTCISL